jgi:hypothetical protein
LSKGNRTVAAYNNYALGDAKVKKKEHPEGMLQYSLKSPEYLLVEARSVWRKTTIFSLWPPDRGQCKGAPYGV